MEGVNPPGTTLLVQDFIRWLREDSPFGDLTSELLIPKGVRVRAVVIAKSEAIAACVEDLAEALNALGVRVTKLVPSGTPLKPRDVVMELVGEARKLLLVERTLLNLVKYLFGVATTTRTFVEEARRANPRVRVAATRKVIPGLRYLAKKAVRAGGGDTHRFSLSDGVIIKDNHLAVIGDVSRAVKLAREGVSFMHRVDVEVQSLEDAIKAAEAGADVVMLDNMTPEQVREVVEELRRRGLRDRVIVEVSGGITPENLREYASLDVDVISTSYITMNPVRVDVSLEFVEVVRGP